VLALWKYTISISWSITSAPPVCGGAVTPAVLAAIRLVEDFTGLEAASSDILKPLFLGKSTEGKL
jgi:hypothetical protein